MLLILIFAIMAFLYWLFLIFTTEINLFDNIWLSISAILFLIYYLTKKYLKYPKKIPLNILVFLYVCIISGIIVFIISSLFIFTYSGQKSEEKLDYVIVLGSKLNKQELATDILLKRLDKAIEYSNENPDTIFVLSGGRLKNTNISEAQIMANYLINKGVDRKRILLEIESHNTRENIIYSGALIENQLKYKRDSLDLSKINIQSNFISAENRPKRIGIISSDFHLYRVSRLAKSADLQVACFIATKSKPEILPNMYLRECIAMLKEKFMGYI